MLTSKIIHSLTAAATVSIIMATVYVVVQQNYRTSANDPQIQMAQYLKERLEQGKSIEHLLPPDSIDLKKSLQVYTTFFDGSGKPVSTTAYLNNTIPSFPAVYWILQKIIEKKGLPGSLSKAYAWLLLSAR